MRSQKSVTYGQALPWQTAKAMRANELMKRNIRALLDSRGQNQRSLARWCQRSESWLSKVLQEDKREIPVKYFDRIADFFGVETYQLFQPGVDPLLERRKAPERRSGVDRRFVSQSDATRQQAVQLARRIAALDESRRRAALETVTMLERAQRAESDA
jgi:transcriptional regulator with XRE-family HTH domain